MLTLFYSPRLYDAFIAASRAISRYIGFYGCETSVNNANIFLLISLKFLILFLAQLGQKRALPLIKSCKVRFELFSPDEISKTAYITMLLFPLRKNTLQERKHEAKLLVSTRRAPKGEAAVS